MTSQRSSLVLLPLRPLSVLAPVARKLCQVTSVFLSESTFLKYIRAVRKGYQQCFAVRRRTLVACDTRRFCPVPIASADLKFYDMSSATTVRRPSLKASTLSTYPEGNPLSERLRNPASACHQTFLTFQWIPGCKHCTRKNI